ncbi:MAG: TetR family transcriptional regulator [Desulfobacterota bacterium]|jgi:AcrR family transcriptional regulator|nr:TetR family transcriptional regulator [Thermodesulfobacteriota bacterium]
MRAIAREDRSESKSGTLGRILVAAREEFAQKGFAGARVDGIARRAGVNKATLYYQIGDKKALYAEVIHDVVGTAAMKIAEGIRDEVSPEDKIRTYIKILAKTFDDNPQMPRIIMREIASGGQNLPGVFFQDLMSIIATLTDIIDQGRASGVFAEAMPLLVHFMAIGATVIYKSVAPIMLATRGVPEEVGCRGEQVSGVVADEIGRLILKALAG